jgi:hypothetical protein
MGREPGAGSMRELEGWEEALAGTMNAQDVANTLWVYATMGREPGDDEGAVIWSLLTNHSPPSTLKFICSGVINFEVVVSFLLHFLLLLRHPSLTQYPVSMECPRASSRTHTRTQLRENQMHSIISEREIFSG